MKALDKQPGGNHYKDYAIQPIEFITRNLIPYREANVIKYIVRHRDKNGLEDLQKAMHYIEMLIEDYENESDNSGVERVCEPERCDPCHEGKRVYTFPDNQWDCTGGRSGRGTVGDPTWHRHRTTSSPMEHTREAGWDDPERCYGETSRCSGSGVGWGV